MSHERREERHEHAQLDRIERKVDNILEELEELEHPAPRLTSIQIQFGGIMNKPSDSHVPSLVARRAAVTGPASVTLNVGQSTVASVTGFDQNGNPFTGTMPPIVWSMDNPLFDSIVADPTVPANEDITSLAAGTANLTAALTTAEGLALTAAGVITNVAVAGVLTTINMQFSVPTGGASVSVAVAPTSATVAQGSTQQFTATVTGDPKNLGVTWSTTAGTVDTTGLYTPPTPGGGTTTVVATSAADTTKSASAAVTF